MKAIFDGAIDFLSVATSFPCYFLVYQCRRHRNVSQRGGGRLDVLASAYLVGLLFFIDLFVAVFAVSYSQCERKGRVSCTLCWLDLAVTAKSGANLPAQKQRRHAASDAAPLQWFRSTNSWSQSPYHLARTDKATRVAGNSDIAAPWIIRHSPISCNFANFTADRFGTNYWDAHHSTAL